MPHPFKQALQAGHSQVGLWSSLCSPIAAEILASCGFDWVLLTRGGRALRDRFRV
jgi:4-hydroxy-2-oxoheptanedioate aldolase